ncbi:1426_t:CDS:1, partial [Scutellospora calospora]
MNQSVVSSLSIFDSYSLKHAKIEDIDLDHINSDYVKNKTINKHNEKYVKNDELGENITSESKRR